MKKPKLKVPKETGKYLLRAWILGAVIFWGVLIGYVIQYNQHLNTVPTASAGPAAATVPAPASPTQTSTSPTTSATATGTSAKATSTRLPDIPSCRLVETPYQTTNQSVSPSDYRVGTTSLGLQGENSICTYSTGRTTTTVVNLPSNNVRYVADPSMATPTNPSGQTGEQYCAAYAGSSYFNTCVMNYDASH